MAWVWQPLLPAAAQLQSAASISGSAASSLGAIVGTASGAIALKGSAASTLGAITAVGSGRLSITAVAAASLGDVVAASAASLPVAAAAATVAPPVIASASARLEIKGAAHQSLGEITGSASGNLLTPIVGVAAATVGAIGAASTAVIGSRDLPQRGSALAALAELRKQTARRRRRAFAHATLGEIVCRATGELGPHPDEMDENLLALAA